MSPSPVPEQTPTFTPESSPSPAPGDGRPLRPVLDPLVGYLAVGVLGALVLFDLVPSLFLSVSALIQGVSTGEFPAGGGLGATESFPRRDPQLWMTWIPVCLYVAWSILSFPLPLSRHRFKRGFMMSLGVTLFCATVARVAGFVGSDRFSDGGTYWIFVVIVVAIALILVRIVAGWLRLVPRSWRGK